MRLEGMPKRTPKDKAKSSPRDLKSLKDGGSDVRREWMKSWVPLLGTYASPAELAEELGVTYQTLRRWGRAHLPDPVPAGMQKLIVLIATAKGVKPPTF